MLVTKTVKVNWSNSNKEYYTGLGYYFTKLGDEFEVSISHATPHIRAKIKMKCINPDCNNTKEISFSCYLDRLREGNDFICSECFQNGLRLQSFLHKELNEKCKENNCNNNQYENGCCYKHFIQKRDLGYILKPLEHPCDECGSENNVQYHTKTQKYLCRKHRIQIDRHGEILKRTIYDDNEIILHKDYAEILLYNIDGEVIAKAQIDLEDVDKVKKYKWHLGDTGYVLCCIKSFNIRLHKFIIGQYDDYNGHDYDNMIDHKDRNKLNNRRYNLRNVDDSSNKQNRDLLISNKTGRTGLQHREQKNKPWRTELTINGEKVISKSFKTREEAEYVLDLYILYYKKFDPSYEALKLKYISIYDDLMKNGVEKYENNFQKERKVS